MKRTLLFASILATSAFALPALAKAPPNATGECKDGTYTEAKSKEGACSSHGGVKSWNGPEKSAAAERPAGATGQCKDGSYTDAASKSGACSGHKGVKEWFGGTAAKTTAKDKDMPAPESTRPTAKQTQAPGPGTARSTVAQPSASERPAPPSERTAAAGGGHGKVWVNTDSKVYHCESDALYGKTKQGEYMSESQAKAAGARASRGKACG